jgi:hypothetical protein
MLDELVYRIYIIGKRKKKVGVLEVPLNFFRLMKNSTFLKVDILNLESPILFVRSFVEFFFFPFLAKMGLTSVLIIQIEIVANVLEITKVSIKHFVPIMAYSFNFVLFCRGKTCCRFMCCPWQLESGTGDEIITD